MSKTDLKNKNITEESAIKPRRNLLIAILANKILFSIHLFLYLAVMALLMVIWAVTLSMVNIPLFWPLFPMLGWGIGIGIHAITYLMFNDKVEYLSKVRKQSNFGILFIYHAFIYTLVNLIVISANLMADPEHLVFGWTLGMWGIIFGIHALGFFTYDFMVEREVNFFKKKFAQYEDKKYKMLARTKIFNFWLLIANIAYFIVGNILIYTYLTGENTIEGTLMWGTMVGVHAFAFLFYYYVASVKAAFKGLIIHLAFFGALIGWGIYQLSKITAPNILIVIEPVLIWAILIGFHAFAAYKWEPIIADAIAIVERQAAGKLDKYDIKSRAGWLAVWKWSFFAHICIYGVVLILTGIQISLLMLPIDILLHTAFGEAIGLAMHGAIYFVLLKNIRKFWRWTFILHLIAYIVVGAYLITINIVYTPQFAWSAISLAGWGIGLGLHYLIARFADSYKVVTVESK